MERKFQMPYQAKYIRTSKIRDLLVEGDTKIRVSGDAKDKLAEYLDNAVAAATKELIEKLPRKSKGASKGELKRITIQQNDFE
jgi:histone H3/H4